MALRNPQPGTAHRCRPPLFIGHLLPHVVFSKKRGYTISKSAENGNLDEIDLTDYLKDMFSSHYAAFLLNFGMSELLEALG